ncbi:MAG: ABC transporter permease subunit [Anaerolineae bacterium]
MSAQPSPGRPALSRSFWRDERFLKVATQVLVVVIIAGFAFLLARNMVASLRKQGIALGFDFLSDSAGFDIGEMLITYTNTDTFGRALQVGLLNTLVICAVGVLLATVLGILVGLARLSENFLVNRMARLFVEAMRNVPLLVLLIFIYSAFFLKLPRVRQAIELPGPIFLSNRGVSMPWGIPTASARLYLLMLMLAVVGAIVTALMVRQRSRRLDRPQPVFSLSLLAFVVIAVLGWFVMPQSPLRLDLPAVQGLNFSGGRVFTPEFLALLLGLVIYTAAFIGEIVRAGIQAVSKGQREAASALGLTGNQILRLIIFPQALRVIIPPLTSQYLNLIKNSTLGVAIGYPDLFAISGTVINQTGRAVEMIAIIMGLYLAASLLTAAAMNWYNQRVRLVER